jgi:hypothetical protein
MRKSSFKTSASSILPVIVASLILTACGGDSSSAPALQGLWSGVFETVGFIQPPVHDYPVVGGIIVGGPALFFDDSGIVYSLNPSLTDPGPYNGKMIQYGPFVPNEPMQPHESPSMGTVTTASIQMSHDQPDHSWSFVASPHSAYSGTPSFSAGDWQGITLNINKKLDLSVDGAGTISGTDAYGCSVRGALSQQGANQNLYKATYEQSKAPGSTAGACGGAFSGIGFLSSTDESGKLGDGTFFYLAVIGSSYGYAMEFKMP